METRKIEVGGGVQAVLPTGPYQNERPSFFVKMTFDASTMTDDEVFKLQAELQEKSYANLKNAEQRAIISRIEIERKDFRWYKFGDQMFPSVTSVINFDADFFMEPHLLRQYAAQGLILDGRCTHYIAEGEWLDAKAITDKYPNLWVEYVILKKGDLGLPVDGVDFPKFCEKYPIKANAWKVKVTNEESRYGGELDFWGVPEANEKEGIQSVQTVIDIKRTPDKHKNFMQIAAYSMALKSQGIDIKQMMIIPLNPGKTQQGYSKPIISTEIEKYFALFMEKREQFKRRYGI